MATIKLDIETKQLIHEYESYLKMVKNLSYDPHKRITLTDVKNDKEFLDHLFHWFANYINYFNDLKIEE